MNRLLAPICLGVLTAMILMSCQPESQTTTPPPATPAENPERVLVQKYVPVKLTTDLAALSESDKKLIPLLIEAAQIMDQLFWKEAVPANVYVDISKLSSAERAFYDINYGPWDRLEGNEPFIAGIGPKPAGANFYPTNMTKEEFEAFSNPKKKDLYTLIRRDEREQLEIVPYHEAFREEVKRAAELLNQAANISDSKEFSKYLRLRAKALLRDDYDTSDIAWLDMKDNTLDLIIGPIETYEDQLFGYKAAHEAYVLVKDQAWSQRLERYVAFLPTLQAGLPVDERYKAETPGGDAQLNAYDVVYYAGDCNAGSKTIAVNLPNDEDIQRQKGTRRSQLKNAMKAKYDKILLPIADLLIAEDQREHLTFEAFFANTMFHEVAHGLGIKETINGKGTVRESLREESSALEEGKADILGIYMVEQLFQRGEITEGKLEDYYVTFLAGIFRSVRFGASSAHGRANSLRFNFFKERGAFSYDQDTQTYRVNPEQMRAAIADLSELILTLQGDGDYEGVKKLMSEKGKIGSELQADLDRLNEAGIPVDVVFEQGTQVLGL
ncbi:dipeptidyl-peptidase 3 family protein [Pontibacter sp. G13]|uniref:dipeptidyl-peptidase 3 family protein n=1 Tax=Pontibacter sp. G13 TaxID=3074898 RepID=UPI00288951CD|nr:Zn-dependent hydrolase [Pontibacter sp. G13]WNJ16676.1 Zn-dependent hydrolase [Pontibacter sp. G13]